jgi:hypothetical protein
MKANEKIGSNGVYVSDNVEKRFETDIYGCMVEEVRKGGRWVSASESPVTNCTGLRTRIPYYVCII